MPKIVSHLCWLNILNIILISHCSFNLDLSNNNNEFVFEFQNLRKQDKYLKQFKAVLKIQFTNNFMKV